MRLSEKHIYWLAGKLVGTTLSLEHVWTKGEALDHETLCALSELICQCKCGEWFWWLGWDESPKNEDGYCCCRICSLTLRERELYDENFLISCGIAVV
jgi:hypothetical protein